MLDDPMLSDVWGDRLTRLDIDVTALGPIGTLVVDSGGDAVTASDNRVPLQVARRAQLLEALQRDGALRISDLTVGPRAPPR